jgi:hypothetical protein
MPPAETPDFDSMSPEEVMAWMESLAKRQGAVEGFTTAADMQIEEIDPASVHLDEPGYVPFGEESSHKASAPAEAPPPAPEPTAPAPLPLPDEEDEQETQPAPAALSGIAWLESLAADQGDFPELDLSSLSAEIESDAVTAEPTNPVDWLESLAGDDAVIPQTPPVARQPVEPEPVSLDDLSSIDDPLAAGVDPMAWLESLARRQGARDEELTTAATQPAAPPPPPAPPPAQPETADPAAWLQSLAMGEDEQAAPAQAAPAGGMTDQDIQKALQSGVDIPHDEMAAFLDRQLQRQLEAGDEPMMDFDPDAPAEPADLPDWLLEQVQPPLELTEQPATGQPALLDEIIEPPAIEDLELPDWLRDDAVLDDSADLESIFASDEPAVPAASVAAPAEPVGIDTDDPWVIAFDEERQADPDEIPEWYQRNLNDPGRIAAVEQQFGLGRGMPEAEAMDEGLLDADLPEELELMPGELEPDVPDWLSEEIMIEADEPAPDMPDWLAAQVEDVPEAAADLPDWLRDAEVDIDSAEIPDWLRETVQEEMAESSIEVVDEAPPAPPPQPAAPPPAPQVIAPAPQPPPPAPQPVSPVPVPAAMAIDVEATLAQARHQVSSGNLSGGLIEYESIIRANQALEIVVDDLTKLIEQQRDTPAVYRVLGDSYMRQGRLQSALDTYRKSLNQL